MSKYYQSRIKSLKGTLQVVSDQFVATQTKLQGELDAANSRIAELARTVINRTQTLQSFRAASEQGLAICVDMHNKHLASLAADHVEDLEHIKHLAELARTDAQATIRTLQNTITAMQRTMIRELKAG